MFLMKKLKFFLLCKMESFKLIFYRLKLQEVSEN